MVTELSGILEIQNPYNVRISGCPVGALGLGRLAINHLTSTRRDLFHFEIVTGSQRSQAATRSRSASPERVAGGTDATAGRIRTMGKCGTCNETGHNKKNYVAGHGK